MKNFSQINVKNQQIIINNFLNVKNRSKGNKSKSIEIQILKNLKNVNRLKIENYSKKNKLGSIQIENPQLLMNNKI